MTASTWMKTAIGLGGLWLCVQGMPAWGSPTETAGVAVQPTPPSPAGNAELANSSQDRAAFVQTYQGREQMATTQKNFEGGGAGLYIGGSTAAIVLLLVILIVVL
ncbi:MAG: hypothetical protein SF187_25990 [Deltaproteobacteria bacterium]|nr:hypothetical protein [Deltaproteobacteria bacterium]